MQRMKTISAIAFVASIALLSVLVLGAEPIRKPRLSVVAGLEGGEAGVSAFGAENARTVLSMINAYAIDSEAFTVIGTSDREAAMAELEFSLSSMADDANQLRLGRMLAAESILSARCGKAGDYYVVQLTLVDVQSGAVQGNALGKYRNLGTLLESLRSLVGECIGAEDRDGQGRLRFITVRNAVEFLSALGSDRVITLEPGTYDLSNKSEIKHANLTWKNDFDGFYPIVKSVSDLTIRSSGGARVVIAPSYGWVMEFQTSRGLRFQGVEFVHTKPGYCLGGVLRFELCEGVEIFDCSLDGSGTYGLELSGSRNFSMEKSRIRNCTYGIMQLFRSSDAEFKGSEFTNNGEFDLISLVNSSNVDFSGCSILDNRGDSLVSADGASYGVVFTDCRILGNRVKRISDNQNGVAFVGCTIE
jgi:hypothetical protein